MRLRTHQPDNIGHKLELIKLYNEQQTTVRDLIDKWFANYLLIIGAPFPIVIALAHYKELPEVDTRYWWLFAFAYTLLGLHFFWINVRQRMSAITYYKRINEIETVLQRSLMKKEVAPWKLHNFGADFWKAGVIAFFNSLWFCMTLYFWDRQKILAIDHHDADALASARIPEWAYLIVLGSAYVGQHVLRIWRIWVFNNKHNARTSAKESESDILPKPR